MFKQALVLLYAMLLANLGHGKGYPDYQECTLENAKLICFPQSSSPGSYLHPSVLTYIDKKQVSSIFEIGSRDALDAIRLSLFYKRHVYAFECNPECLVLCKLNAEQTPNVTLVDKALWDGDGEIDFYPILNREGKIHDPGSSSCFQLLSKHHEHYSQAKISVPAIRLDQWMNENNLKSVDLICMSVQGASLKVLQGMGKLIKKTKYIITRCEVENLYEGECLLPELSAFLKENGFEKVPTDLPFDYMFVNKHCLAQKEESRSFFRTLFGSRSTDLTTQARHAISYEYCPGRFGDKILGYSHARYLSYATKLPFLSRPFPNSEFLTIEYQSIPFAENAKQYCQIFHIKSADTLAEFFRKIQDPNTPPTLFVVDYFPADTSEWDWPYTWWTSALVIPWKEKAFANYLRKSLQPKIPIPDFTVTGRLNVADHIRHLSGPDTAEASPKCFPLKMPSLNYHERQIRRVYEWNGKRPMHVFIFSDTKTPLEFLEQIKGRFTSEDILFNIQALEKPDVNYVVQDFFAMQKFDVLITTQSNLSMMASRLADFDMVISPVHAVGEYPNSEVDRIQLITKKSDWFPYELNTVLRENLPNRGPKR